MSTDENPRLFTKDCKLHVIEYGGVSRGKSWSEMKPYIMSFNPVNVVQSLLKH